MSRYQILHVGAWPSGQDKPAAQLRFTAADIGRKLGPPVTDSDDLGVFQQWGLRLNSGRLVLLAQYDDTPAEGVVAYVDSQEDVDEALTELASALALESRDFTWVRDERAGDLTV
jgi:hypothetical protein